jgi:hypothetical protein
MTPQASNDVDLRGSSHCCSPAVPCAEDYCELAFCTLPPRRLNSSGLADLQIGRSLSIMHQLRAILLDVDGTLIDSNDAHARSWCDALAEFDRPVEFERIRRLIGKGGDKLLAETVGLSDTEGLGSVETPIV